MGDMRTMMEAAPKNVRASRHRPPAHGDRRSLRVAMLAACPFPTHQGTQVFIRHLATALANAGHEIHLVTYGYGEYCGEEKFIHHPAAAINCGLRSGMHWRKPAADAALLHAAWQVIEKYDCQLIHAHNVEALGVGTLLKQMLRRPVIYHCHNAMGAELPTYFAGKTARYMASMVGEQIDRYLPTQANAVITFDPDHKALHELYGIHERNIYVIPPGLDGQEIRNPLSADVRQLSEQLGPGPWVLYAGNPDGYQNLSLLYDAFAVVRRHHPTAGLLIATQHAPSAFSPPRDLPIVVHQYHDIKELRALFALAQVGVCPRVLWTGAPIKVLNYLAAGLPVVACRSATRHIITSDGGIATEPQPEAFGRAIVALLRKKEAMSHRTARGFERFRVRDHVPLYESMYQRVLTSAD